MKKYCQKCVLPEHKPEIYLNEDGVCNICLNYQKNKDEIKGYNFVETEFQKIISKHKKKKEKYDCLVLCSGGRDSISSLYYIKKRYKLNPLAFTFDNYFEDQQAIKNIHNAVETLDVDWIYFKSNYMNEMYQEMIDQSLQFPICPLCSLWYMQLVYDTATKYNLSLIIGGWTKGQFTSVLESSVRRREEDVEFSLLCRDIPDFITEMRDKYPKYKDFPKNMEELSEKYKIAKKVTIISPHWFLPFDAEEYTKLIQDKLNWKPISSSYPKHSTNCGINMVGSYLSLKRFGFTHFHIEMSKLIREGKLSREEAWMALKMEYDTEDLNKILSKIGCTIK